MLIKKSLSSNGFHRTTKRKNIRKQKKKKKKKKKIDKYLVLAREIKKGEENESEAMQIADGAFRMVSKNLEQE